MSWNYRLVHRKCKPPEGYFGPVDEDFYAVHEVHYDAEGKPRAVSENPAIICGESRVEANECRIRMLDAFRRDVLEWDDIAQSDDNAARQVAEVVGGRAEP